MRVGKVVSVNKLKGTCRVNYFEDNQTSIELPISANIYKMPKVDDLVLVAPLTGAKGIVICTFFNDNNTPKQDDGIRIEFNDNSYISIDKNGAITLKGSKVIIDTNLEVNGTIKDNAVNISSHTHIDSEGGTTSPPQ